MKLDPVTRYARQVVAGRVPAGSWQHAACQRHLDDLVHGSSRALRFAPKAAFNVVDFFRLLCHSKGEMAGQPFSLAPWQAFIVGSLWGWRRADGTRRFRKAYNEVPRKNGKSTLSAGLALLLAFFDGEHGADVYCAATKRDQAKIVFDEAKRMRDQTPALRSVIAAYAGNLSQLSTNSKLEPLGADADTTDGLNIHGAIVDELHAHKTRAMIDVLETATGARRQPLQFEITTAGYDRHSVCWEHHEYSAKVLEGVFTDDAWFAFICTADEDDDWTDETVWAKANPNLGISVSLDDLRTNCEQATKMPAAQNAFRRLHLNQWTEQADRWIDIATWDASAGEPIDVTALAGRRCYAGLDLSSTRDLSALVLLFPNDDDRYDVVPYFWVPEDSLRQRVQRDHVPYDVWMRDRHLLTTPGNVIDYECIRQRVHDCVEQFDLRELGYDPWNATQLIVQLEADGVVCFPVRQGFASMAAPTKELEKLVPGQRLHHGGHPVLRWNASNVATEQDSAGNIKPSKAKSTARIDGIVALVMAIDRASRHTSDGPLWFEAHGIITV